MQENSTEQSKEKLEKWIKQQLDSAVRELMGRRIFESVMIEAKPAWVFPFGLLIGMVREQETSSGFDWFISGDFPTATVHSSVAETARDAARHFALAWQLEAKRLEDGISATSDETKPPATSSPEGLQLVERAQSLYELVEQDSLWEPA